LGSSERKEKAQKIRREDILNAAERVFFTKGYRFATMDDVAKAAEYSKRTVYVYFNSKEQIYFSIMIRGYRLLLRMLEENRRDVPPRTAVEAIKQIAETLYHFSKQAPDYFDAIIEYENNALDFQKGVSDCAKEECYALGERVLGYLTDALNEGIAEGFVDSDLNVERTALILWACGIGVFRVARRKKRYLEHYHSIKPEELISAAFTMMIRCIRTETGG
jgi:AcrR family transcriptional regulator